MASTIAIERSPIRRRFVTMAVAAFVAAGAVTGAVVIGQTGEQVEAQNVAPTVATDAAGDHPIRSTIVHGRLQAEWRSGYDESISTVEMGRLQATWRGGGYVEPIPTIEMGRRLAEWR